MYYVTCTDRFLSGWSTIEGRHSKMVCVAATYDEAEHVRKRWAAQTGLKYVNIRSTKPYYKKCRYHTSWYVYSKPYINLVKSEPKQLTSSDNNEY